MGDIYTMPTENQTLGFNEIVAWTNDVTNNLLFPLILLAMFVISFVGTMHFGNGKAFTYSMFFCSILAIFMVVARMLNPAWMYLCFIGLGVALLIMRLIKSSTLPQI
jgi:hypothetical protein